MNCILFWCHFCGLKNNKLMLHPSLLLELGIYMFKNGHRTLYDYRTLCILSIDHKIEM